MSNCDGIVPSILDFSSYIIKYVGQLSDESSSPSSEPDTFTYFHALPLPTTSSTKQEKQDLKTNAVKIWNLCNNTTSRNIHSNYSHTVAYFRAFAYLLLISTRHLEDLAISTRSEWLRFANVSVRLCMTYDILEVADKILEYAAGLHRLLLQDKEASEEVPNGTETTIFEYRCLRIASVWKKGRMDLANYHYETIESELANTTYALANVTPDAILGAADLFWEIGSQEASMQELSAAVLWLTRAKTALSLVEEASEDVANLELNILHCLVRVLRDQKTTESLTEAQSYSVTLCERYSHKLAVQILFLEILAGETLEHQDDFSKMLQKMIRSAHLIEKTHRIIIHYIHHLYDAYTTAGIRILHEYIVLRLAGHGNNEWLQTAIITFIWFTVRAFKTCQISRISPEQDLDVIVESCPDALDSDAARSCHAFLWQSIESYEGQNGSRRAIDMCLLAMHVVFEKSGEANKNKFERRLMSLYLERDELGAAHKVLLNMSSKGKDHILTKYLSYCLSLRQGFDQEVAESFASLASKCQNDDGLLKLALKVTMDRGNDLQKACILQRLIDKDGYNPHSLENTLKFVALTVKFLRDSLLQKPLNQGEEDEIQERFLAVFKSAIRICKSKSTKPYPHILVQNLQWLSAYARSMAMQQYQLWPRRHILDLLEYSNKISAIAESETSNEKSITHVDVVDTLLCQIILYTIEARQCNLSWTAEDLPQTSYDGGSKPRDSQIKHLLYQQCFEKFTKLQSHPNHAQAAQICEKATSHSCLSLPLAFEALAFLSSEAFFASERMLYDDVSLLQLIDTASRLEAPAKTYGLIADVILSNVTTPIGDSEHGPHSIYQPFMPVTSATRLLSRIVQVLRHSETYDTLQAVRWIRCIAQLLADSLIANLNLNNAYHSASTSNDLPTLQMLLAVLDEAVVFASTRQETDAPHDHDGDVEMYAVGLELYPSIELEWLASTAFNVAVDLYAVGRAAHARECTGRAVRIADVLARYEERDRADGRSGTGYGLLARVLRERVADLGWEFRV